MKERILFIGAGASHAARPEDPPPMGDGLLGWLQEQLKSFKRQGDIEYRSSNLNLARIEEMFEYNNKYFRQKKYEKFIEIILGNTKFNDGNIQKFMSIAFLVPEVFKIKNCFQKKIDLYDDLIKSLKIESISNAISLNYDILFEEAVGASQFRYAAVDNGENNKEDGHVINIFKPHGSISFYTKPILFGGNSQSFAAAEEQKLNSPDFYNDIICLPFRAYKDRRELEKYVLETQDTYPVMAHYTEGKKSSCSYDGLQKIRELALNLLSEKNVFSEIIIIGIKPIFKESDDPFVAKFMTKLEKMECAITYVGFDQKYKDIDEDALIFEDTLESKERILELGDFTDCQKMKIKFGNKVKIYSDGLEDYINKIRSEFSKDSRVHTRNQSPSESSVALSY